MVRPTDHPAMTTAVDWDVKQQKQTKQDRKQTKKDVTGENRVKRG